MSSIIFGKLAELERRIKALEDKPEPKAAEVPPPPEKRKPGRPRKK